MMSPNQNGLSALSAIREAFGQADAYTEHAQVQRLVAERLAGRIALSVRAPDMLELGCGTGLLSAHLHRRWPLGSLLCSDLSAPMVQRCRTTLAPSSSERLHFAVLDGENPPFIGEQFDLIAASMVMQWFAQPCVALRRYHALLRPGGSIAMATLAPGTFHEWQSACQAAGVVHGLHRYPSASAWQAAWPSPADCVLEEEEITVQHASGLDFLRGLRAIGAHLPVPGYRPNSAGEMRRILRSLTGPHGVSVTYVVLYGIFNKKIR
ncbi:MAG: methyltransferase domain-containing protein [Magnetococcales bacterium]|nr:methyltransferase domain-containing protein [Magnetococcales bacterium]MBF0116505.1 methyltransferase domain-containing protein [Magnetococcales bacterium]